MCLIGINIPGPQYAKYFSQLDILSASVVVHTPDLVRTPIPMSKERI